MPFRPSESSLGRATVECPIVPSSKVIEINGRAKASVWGATGTSAWSSTCTQPTVEMFWYTFRRVAPDGTFTVPLKRVQLAAAPGVPRTW